jgi:cytochrome c oxidase subunit 2
MKIAWLHASIAVAAPQQSVLQPAGVQAVRIAHLWHLTLLVCAVVFALILLALIVALLRSGRSSERTAPDLSSSKRTERGPTRAVRMATAASVIGLAALLAADIWTDRALSRLPAADAVRVQMIGHQWWWEMRYLDADGKPDFVTANELHVPVGRAVIIDLDSPDVIHTFWVPNLHGKKDMIPGRAATIEFRADQAGAYRGQCAEFCGAEHALMAFFVTAQPDAEFQAWMRARREPAAAIADGLLRQGHDLFIARACASCHAVRGTEAAGTVGPDLTHLASRPDLAAGTVLNNAANLAAWITNPQSLKPGTTMPATPLTAEEQRAVVAYLGSLR